MTLSTLGRQMASISHTTSGRPVLAAWIMAEKKSSEPPLDSMRKRAPID